MRVKCGAGGPTGLSRYGDTRRALAVQPENAVRAVRQASRGIYIETDAGHVKYIQPEKGKKKKDKKTFGEIKKNLPKSEYRIPLITVG